jgi:two-component system sensor histidine kinase BarA
MLSKDCIGSAYNNGTPYQKGGVNVLIVEDDILSAHVASRFLTDLGCNVHCAKDDKETLVCFENDKTEPAYDLVFMDISLSGMDGYTLAQKLQKTPAFLNSPIPIIALTAYGDEKSKRRCLEVGMSAVLVKPLLKTTAQEILKAFIPHWSEKRLENSLNGSSEPLAVEDVSEVVIDFSHILDVYDNDIEFIKSALQVILDSLDLDLKQLEYECNAKSWSAGRVIIHRLQGGTRYFGLKRVDQVCEKFTQVLQQAPDSNWLNVYQRLLKEVENVREAYQHWLKEQSNSVQI